MWDNSKFTFVTTNWKYLDKNLNLYNYTCTLKVLHLQQSLRISETYPVT